MEAAEAQKGQKSIKRKTTSQAGIWTRDLMIISLPLYQLRYLGEDIFSACTALTDSSYKPGSWTDL